MENDGMYVLDLPTLQQKLGLKGFAGRLIAKLVYEAVDLEELNKTQRHNRAYTGAPYCEGALKDVGVSYHIPENQLERLPDDGAFILVSNHPFGSVDGLIMEAAVGGKRPDTKVLTTFFLALVPGLKDHFIPVDNFASGSGRSLVGIKTAMQHIADGHPLVMFPAGEVSTYQRRKNRSSYGKKRIVEDIPWAGSVIKLVKKAKVPVYPVYFQGTNSRFFHFLGRIHPRLRTLRLPWELFNKSGQTIEVRIGQAVSPDVIESLDIPDLGTFLRNRCYALEAQCIPETDASQLSFPTPLADPVPEELVRKDMENLPADCILFEDGDYRVCLLKTSDAPNLTRELFRLREEVFRSVGEGTGKPIDTDIYDERLYQLVLWHIPDGQIAGAYRIGDCKAIMEEHGGIQGLYTASLYDYKPEFAPLLSKCMELGRSFVVPKYQREVHPLRLLLAGLGAATVKMPHTEYYLGPVSISNDYPHFYKSLFVHFLKREFQYPDAGKLVTPPHPFVPDFLGVNPDDLLQTVPPGDMDKFDRMMASLSDGRYRLPVLVRKYFSCSAKLLCFNVDPDFTDSLDGLILLRYRDFPERTLNSIMRGVPAELREKIYENFRGTGEQVEQ